MARLVIEVQPRSEQGKNPARRLRRSGRVPAVLYGAGRSALPVSLDPGQLRAVLESETGRNTILDVKVRDGENTCAIIADCQFQPLDGTLLHVDLKRIALDRALRTTVPVLAVGEAPGVKSQGGILELLNRSVEIECLPEDIPEHVEVDVSNLCIGTTLRTRDVKVNEKVRVVSAPDLAIVHVVALRAVEEKPAAEAAPELAPAPAEPEVIRKGKTEKEEMVSEAPGGKKERK